MCPLKKQPAITKFLSGAALVLIHRLKANGISIERTKRCGARGRLNYTDMWEWPARARDLLFPATRCDCNTVGRRRTKDVVSKAIRRARKSYTPPASCPDVVVHKIRSHSGRHRCVNDLKAHDVPREISKRFARISDNGTWERYGRITPDQAGVVIARHVRLQNAWRDMY